MKDYSYNFRSLAERKEDDKNRGIKPTIAHKREGKKGILFIVTRYSKGGVVKFTNHACHPHNNCILQKSRSGTVYLVAHKEIFWTDEVTIRYGETPEGPCWCPGCMNN